MASTLWFKDRAVKLSGLPRVEAVPDVPVVSGVIGGAVATVVLVLPVLSASAASVRFIEPRQGAQVMGVTTLEVFTDATEVDRVEFFVDGTLVGVVRRPPFRIAFDFGASLEPHFILAHVRSHRFQRDDVADLRTAAVGGEWITVNLVEVPLRVHAPGAVTAKDFTVIEDGVRQAIRDVIQERPVSRFVFLVDRSQTWPAGSWSPRWRRSTPHSIFSGPTTPRRSFSSTTISASSRTCRARRALGRDSRM